MSDEFTCDQCHGVFEKAWSDAERDAEAAEVWGDDLGDNPAHVCDDCYRAMSAVLPFADFRAKGPFAFCTFPACDCKGRCARLISEGSLALKEARQR